MDLQTKKAVVEDLLLQGGGGVVVEEGPIHVLHNAVAFLHRVHYCPPLDDQDGYSPVVAVAAEVGGDADLPRSLPCPTVRPRRIQDSPGFQC
jgi:hypothetical protein